MGLRLCLSNSWLWWLPEYSFESFITYRLCTGTKLDRWHVSRSFVFLQLSRMCNFSLVLLVQGLWPLWLPWCYKLRPSNLQQCEIYISFQKWTFVVSSFRIWIIKLHLHCTFIQVVQLLGWYELKIFMVQTGRANGMIGLYMWTSVFMF